MRVSEETGRFFKWGSLAILVAASLCHDSWGTERACLEPAKHQRLQKTYDDLNSQFDLPTIAQAYLDLSGETSDLKKKVRACRKGDPASTAQDCTGLAKQYGAQMLRQQALTSRFNTALDMQEYISSLKLRLLEPECGK